MSLQSVLSERGISDKELAELIGVSRPHASKLRRGVRGPSPALALKLEAELGIPAADFFFKRDAAA